jgi:hypothetical protein
MPFVVPKFIERKPKIVGPLTFQQFIYIGAAGGICFILYFTTPLYIFLTSCFVLIGGASVLAFGKINGRPIPLMLKNFFAFLPSSKIYLWKKKGISPKLVKIEKVKKEKVEKKPVLNIAEKSRLKNLSAKIEIGNR